jgi:dolichol-phosphate mannosyltransferase
MPEHCELSIVLPAYREAAVLRHLLPRIKARASRLTPDYEVVVVDTVAPVDATERVCAENGVRHVFRTGGNAYGDAVRTAIRESRGRFVIMMDADGSHNPDYFEGLWRERNEYDVVIASRYINGGYTKVHLGLTLMSQLLNVVYRWTVGLRVRDMSNSFRLYHGPQLRALSLETTNFEILEEILVLLLWGPAQAKMLEIPVVFEKRNAGMSKRILLKFINSYVRSIPKLRRMRATAMAECQAGRKCQAGRNCCHSERSEESLPAEKSCRP